MSKSNIFKTVQPTIHTNRHKTDEGSDTHIPSSNGDSEDIHEIHVPIEPSSESTLEKQRVELTPDMLLSNKKSKQNKIPNYKIKSYSYRSSKRISIAALCIALIALIAGVYAINIRFSKGKQIHQLSSDVYSIQTSKETNPDHATLLAVQKELEMVKQELVTLQGQLKTSLLEKQKEHTNLEKVAVPPVNMQVKQAQKATPQINTHTWTVIISSHNSMAKAKNQQQRQPIKGMQTSIIAANVKGHPWYRVVAAGFPNRQSALEFVQKLKQQGITDAWMHSRSAIKN